MAIPQTPSPLAAVVAAKTYNAQWFSGNTPEAQITNAIAAAALDGSTQAAPIYVFIPGSMRGCNPGLVTFNANVPTYTEDDLAKAGIVTNGAFGAVVMANAFAGATVQLKLTAAIAFAKAGNFKYVFIPESFLPYDGSTVTYDKAVQLTTNLKLQPGVLDARAYGGLPNAGTAIQIACGFLPDAGGVVDARGFTGNQVVAGDMLFSVATEKPIKIEFGRSTWSCQQGNFATILSFFGSNIEINGNETTFILNDGQNQSAMFHTDVNAGVAYASVTNGNATITIPGSGPNALTRGVLPVKNKAISIFGHVPTGGQRDNTTLNGAIDGVQTAGITLTSTAGLMTTTTQSAFGFMSIKIDNEIISYTGYSGNVLTGVTRGQFGSTAAAHLNLAAVDRVVYDNYIIRTVSGSNPYTITLDRAVTGVTGTLMASHIGPADCSMTGTLTLDGNRPAADTTANGEAVQIWYGCRFKTDRTCVFQNWDHACVHTNQHMFAVIDGTFLNTGTQSAGLGFTVLFFTGSKYCTAYGDYENVTTGPACDDRTSVPQDQDNSSLGCKFFPRTINNVLKGVVLEGTSHSFAFIPSVENWNLALGGYAFGLNNPQWNTAGVASGNVVIIGFVSPVGTIANLSAGSINNEVVSYTPGAVINDGGVSNTIMSIDSANVTHYTKQFNMENGFTGTKTFSVADAGQDNPFLTTGTWSIADSGFKVGFQAQAKATHTSGSIGNLIAFRPVAWANGVGGATTNAFSVYVDGQADAAITTFYGVYVNPPAGAGVITNCYGISIPASSRGSTVNVGLNIGNITGTGALALQTAQGAVHFGDDVVGQNVAGATRSRYTLLSPDVSVQTLLDSFNTGSATVPGRSGTVSNHQYGFITNNLIRAQFDTSGNLVSDTINGGTFQDRLGSAAAVSKHVRIPFQASGLTTTSTSDVSVSSFSLPAAALAVNGQAVRLTMRGSAVTQAAIPNIKFGATVVATGTITAANVYEIDAIVTRTGAATQIAVATIDNGTALSVNSRTTPAETLANAITIDFRGSVTAGGTLNVDYVQVEYMAS